MRVKNLESLKIAVFMGGVSQEREISIKSGNAVFLALKDAGLNVIKVDITSDNRQKIKEKIKDLKIDLVFIALHGRFGEDGTLQEILEDEAVAYTGSGPAASRLAMDKIASKKMFLEAHLNVPPFSVVGLSKDDELCNIIEKIGFPLVVKPASSGSSIGLSIIQREEDILKALSLARKSSDSVIIEKFIKGREITVGILDKQSLPPIEIVPDEQFFNFQAKYKSEGTQYIVPARLDKTLLEQFRHAAFSAHKCLSCSGFSRVDMLLGAGDNKIYVLEVNTIPGLTERSLLPKAAKYIGLDFPRLCQEILGLARGL
ncbi:MAG: D-alanine--D-alanine ligase [Candidatus Omnitrophica bacterium]|nr:D-alanine--D-alanine ligase [Candidatus Omnitrophota bacterium]